MRLRFTKMQGAGNDFVVLDATASPIELSSEQVQRLGDRRFGVGADQILVVERSDTPGVDFRYRIFNNSGDEVEHCGNGARCFVRYVRDKGLIDRDTIRDETMNRLLELRLQSDGRVTVDMGAPVFDLARVPFDASGLEARYRPARVRPNDSGFPRRTAISRPGFHKPSMTSGLRPAIPVALSQRCTSSPSSSSISSPSTSESQSLTGCSSCSSTSRS